MSNNKYFIIQDINNGLDSIEDAQSKWLEENHSDKIIIAGEQASNIIVNEEDTAMLCMEYSQYDD